MNRLEKVYKTLELMTEFIEPALSFTNGHLTNFYVNSYTDTFLPEKLKRDLLEVSPEKMKSYVSKLVRNEWLNNGNGDNKKVENFCIKKIRFNSESNPCLEDVFKALSFLINQVNENCVKYTNDELFIEEQKLVSGSRLIENWNFDNFMSEKKMHEVELLSDLIVKMPMLKQKRVDHLIDIGSGKGYLTSFLSFFYGLNVLALDASSINTQGCEKRSARLLRLWDSIIQKAIEKKSTGNNAQIRKRVNRTKAKSDGEKETNSKVEINESKLKIKTLFVKNDSNLLNILNESFDLEDDPNRKFGIVGLHTCGPLGADSLKLFVANENANFIINIPCCYHLLDERYYKSDFWEEKLEALSLDNPSEDFPLSQFLIDKKFFLGLNARNLASFCPEKMISNSKELELADTLYYRTLLQVIIKEKLGHIKLEYMVGRGLGSKCSSFVDYVKKALEKLNLNIKIPDDEIINIITSYDKTRKNELYVYSLLRYSFAPLVENLILLDRLAYLLEQKTVKEAQIVKLFDPSLSPRCNAIIATK